MHSSGCTLVPTVDWLDLAKDYATGRMDAEERNAHRTHPIPCHELSAPVVRLELFVSKSDVGDSRVRVRFDTDASSNGRHAKELMHDFVQAVVADDDARYHSVFVSVCDGEGGPWYFAPEIHGAAVAVGSDRCTRFTLTRVRDSSNVRNRPGEARAMGWALEARCVWDVKFYGTWETSFIQTIRTADEFLSAGLCVAPVCNVFLVRRVEQEALQLSRQAMNPGDMVSMKDIEKLARATIDHALGVIFVESIRWRRRSRSTSRMSRGSGGDAEDSAL